MKKTSRKSTAEKGTPTRAQITARDHSQLSTLDINCRISTKMTELKNLETVNADCAATIKANAPTIRDLKTDIAALEALVERRR